MKPIAIFRHAPSEGPGYFAEFLDARKMPWQLIPIDAGDAVPADARYSGLVFMGGPMSVNDDLPWIPPVLALIRDAVARDIPVLGHCLGGQLMSQALGGVGDAKCGKGNRLGRGQRWRTTPRRAPGLAMSQAFTAFHWHGETFTLPAGAMHLLSSKHCANQA